MSRTKRPTAVLLAGAVLAALVAPALAQGARQARPALPAQDRQFVMKAAKSGEAEVQLSQVAAQYAEHRDVRRFAQSMIQDHSEANSELAQLAAAKRIVLPTVIPLEPEAQASLRRLQGLRGPALDREYMRIMVKDHQMAVALFSRQSRQGRDPQLRRWAAGKLPHLQEHYQQARQLAGKVQAGR